MKSITRQTKKKTRTQSNVIPFPTDDELIVRDVVGSLTHFEKLPGGWAIYRNDGNLFGYLLQVKAEEVTA